MSQLERIADRLGVSVEDLRAGHPEDLDAFAEYVRLWHRLATPAKRRTALALLRQVADPEPSTPPPATSHDRP